MKKIFLNVVDYGPNTSIVPLHGDEESKKAFLEICPQGWFPWEVRETLYKLVEEKGWSLCILVDRHSDL